MVTRPLHTRDRGFTLIEAIMVITITGILSAMVAVFIRGSVESYMDTARRAELSEAADIALRKLAREVRLAVPNSFRTMTAGGVMYLEFVPTKDGGRYRSEGDGSTAGNRLCRDISDGNGYRAQASFDVLGTMPIVAVNDYVVVFNDASLNKGASCGTLPADVYCATGSRAQISAVGTGSLTTGAALANSTVICPYANSRFQVVDSATQAVTYACPTAVPGNMTRSWGYGFNDSQAVPSGGSSAIVVGNAVCTASYTANALQRNGLLSITLTIGPAGGEQIVVFREIHVDNTP